MISAQTFAAVEESIRAVADEEALARFGRLAEGDVDEKKGPLDLVTVADRRVEERLTRALTRLLPGSHVIGEEAVHADPALLGALLGEDPVWIVDPVDGTSNFVRGDSAFVTQVALAARGELLASWTYRPVEGILATARRGEGAHASGRPLRAAPGGAQHADEVLLVAGARPAHLTADQHRRLYELGAAHGVKPWASGSAGCDYLDVALGRLDAATYAYDNPWDHSAGILLVAEAGGTVLGADGLPFRMAAGPLPFAAARDESAARRVVALLTA
ncbi:inositol monophosphatase family protein [Actinacidiphila glaucinigra]|uniref:inositol monophosphatase family protein n=1 Tax=Actinacidiphila glaucinigra TaxID=235986 RepID=UPI002E2EFD2A|nr:inositol monophosphatase family protein [Actinacidiphila glaucinigra]